MRSRFLVPVIILAALLYPGQAAVTDRCGPPPKTTGAGAGAHYRIALELVEKEAWSAAILEFVKASEKEPANALTYIELGIAYGKIDRWDAAVQSHRRSVELAPDCVRAHYNLGVSLDNQNLTAEAGNREYRRVLELDPKHVSAMINLASNVGDRNREEAKALLERAVKTEPNNPKVHLNLGLLLESMGSLERAQEAFQRVVSIDPGALEARKQLSSIWLTRRNWEAVIKECREILELDPYDREIHYRLGQALTQTGKREEARKQLEVVESLRHKEVAQQELQRWLRQGGVYLNGGDVSAAIASFRRAVATDKASADAHMYLGISLAASGNHEQGLDELRSAVRLQPSSPRVHHNLGTVLMEAGREEEAEQAFRKALALNPYFPESHNSIGLILSTRDRTEEALRHFTTAAQLNPYYLEALFNQGLALRSLNRMPEAVDSFRKAVRVAPESPQAYYALAVSLKDLGDLEGARKAFERAESLAPPSPGQDQR